MVGYSLATNKRFDNPISCVVVSLAVFFIMMPQSVTATLAASSPLVTDEVTTAEVTSAFITNYTGNQRHVHGHHHRPACPDALHRRLRR